MQCVVPSIVSGKWGTIAIIMLTQPRYYHYHSEAFSDIVGAHWGIVGANFWTIWCALMFMEYWTICLLTFVVL